MDKIKLIAFDVDGTLIDSRADIVNAVNFTLTKLGLPIQSYRQIVSYIGTGVTDLIRQALGSRTSLLERGVEIFKQYYAQHATDESRLYPGVKQILDFFYQKITLAVVTNRSYEMAQSSLKALGIVNFFDKIFTATGDACLKPDPCQLKKVLNETKLLPAEVMVVGDMDIDILSGKKAEVATCAVTYGIGSKEDLIKAEPDYLIDDIIQLKEIVND